ncbi:hypothetical protein TNCT_394571 [Trichonephila clavata]|uniref:Uncharacterized protein n=1 Tax=Trichonephila clavata TaxID=2740835 RepID=A0A8X6J9J7_TRICU|nr:hypothetical protein TNCT_394571 [Trichonephila clavata]
MLRSAFPAYPRSPTFFPCTVVARIVSKKDNEAKNTSCGIWNSGRKSFLNESSARQLSCIGCSNIGLTKILQIIV